MWPPSLEEEGRRARKPGGGGKLRERRGEASGDADG